MADKPSACPPYDVVDIAQEHKVHETALFVGAALAAMSDYAQVSAQHRRLVLSLRSSTSSARNFRAGHGKGY